MFNLILILLIVYFCFLFNSLVLIFIPIFFIIIKVIITRFSLTCINVEFIKSLIKLKLKANYPLLSLNNLLL